MVVSILLSFDIFSHKVGNDGLTQIQSMIELAMYIMRSFFLFFLMLFIWHRADAQSNQPAQANAFAIINNDAQDFVADFCQSVPIEGEGRNASLTGSADETFNGFLKKVLSASGNASATIQSDQYQGVLRQDLASAVAEGNDCRLAVMNVYVDKILPYIFSPTLAPAPQSNQSGSGASQTISTSHAPVLGVNVTQSVDNFIFTIKECHNVETDTVTCSFVINNLGPDRQLFVAIPWINGRPVTFIIDANGITQPLRSADIALTSGVPVGAFVANGVPVNGNLTFGGNGEPITGIPRLYLAIRANDVDYGVPDAYLPIVWKNIPLAAN